MTDDDITPDDMDLAMVDNDSMKDAIAKSDQQAVLLYFQKTQKAFIKTRPGRGTSTVKYVEGWYVKQILNIATKFQWSSFIDGSLRDGDMIIVWGRVVITINGKEYTQSAYGRNEIKYYKCDKKAEVKNACAKGDKSICKIHTCEQPVDIGDSYKSAHTDMIKKAANNWGIAMAVYSGREDE